MFSLVTNLERRTEMLAKRIEQKIFTRYAPKLVNHVMPVPFNEAKGLVAQIYD